MATISCSLDEIYQLIRSVMLSNGCDEPNADALTDKDRATIAPAK